MAKRPELPEGETEYDNLKRSLLNRRPLAAIALVATGLLFAATLTKALRDAFSTTPKSVQVKGEQHTPTVVHPATKKAAEPEATLSVTVTEEPSCGAEPRKSLLDVAINNRSEKTFLLTSVLLEPDWIASHSWAGEIKADARYDLKLDAWSDLATNVALDPKLYSELQRKGKAKEVSGITWLKPDPLPVRAILSKVYAVPKGEPSHFQVSLGLSDPELFIEGRARLVVTTDSGLTLRSELFDIFVCAPPEAP